MSDYKALYISCNSLFWLSYWNQISIFFKRSKVFNILGVIKLCFWINQQKPITIFFIENQELFYILWLTKIYP